MTITSLRPALQRFLSDGDFGFRHFLFSVSSPYSSPDAGRYPALRAAIEPCLRGQ
jgi:hypothetical protein